MDAARIVEEARSIAIRSRTLTNRSWLLGEVLEYDGGLGVRDLLDGRFRLWPNLEMTHLGLTVLVDGNPTKPPTFLDADDIRTFLPHLREHGDLDRAVLAYDKATGGGPPMGRNFSLEPASEVIARKWGRTAEGARQSVERAMRRVCVERHLEALAPLLAERGLELHAYGRKARPGAGHPAVEVVVEPAYERMAAGRERGLAQVGSRIAEVDDVLQASAGIDSNALIACLKATRDEVAAREIAFGTARRNGERRR